MWLFLTAASYAWVRLLSSKRVRHLYRIFIDPSSPPPRLAREYPPLRVRYVLRHRGVPVSADRTHETLIAFLHDLSNRGPYGRHLATDVTFTILGTDEVTIGRADVERCIRHYYDE